MTVETTIDGFLFGLLEDERKSHFLFRAEDTITNFLLLQPPQNELEFPPLNSYYRRIVHRLSHRYGLSHRVESTHLFNADSSLRRMILSKSDETVMPTLKCRDWKPLESSVASSRVVIGHLDANDPNLEDGEEGNDNDSNRDGDGEIAKTQSHQNNNTVETGVVSSSGPAFQKMKILKRSSVMNDNVVGTAKSPNFPSSLDSQPQPPQESLEEREARYLAARERIFKDFTPENSEGQVKANDAPSKVPEVEISELNTALAKLNPNASPFSPIGTTSPIKHIFVLKKQKTDALLYKEDLEIVLKYLATSLDTFLIKCNQIPCSEAYIISSKCDEVGLAAPDEACFSIEPWLPELLVD